MISKLLSSVSILACVLIVSSGAFAQDSVIRIKRDSGRNDVINIGPVPSPLGPTKSPSTESASPTKVSNPAPEGIVQPNNAPSAPSPSRPSVSVAPAKTKSIKSKPASKKKRVVSRRRAPKRMITPTRKPAVPFASMASSPSYVSKYSAPDRIKPIVPSEGGLTADQAKLIAIEYAPPSRNISATRITHNGTAAFIVVFKTFDAGEYTVMVDAQTGEVLKR